MNKDDGDPIWSLHPPTATGRVEGEQRCSFCEKGLDEIKKLILSANGNPRAAICEECVSVCYTLVE